MPSSGDLSPDSTAGQRWSWDPCPTTSNPGQFSIVSVLKADGLVFQGQIQATKSKAATNCFFTLIHCTPFMCQDLSTNESFLHCPQVPLVRSVRGGSVVM